MKNANLAVITVLIIFPALLISACRKDKSAFIVPEQGYGDNRNCQVMTYEAEDHSSVLSLKYDLDTVVKELITTEDGNIQSAGFVQMESPKQLLTFQDNKEPENARTRIYLNDNGSIREEVTLMLNPDGMTYSEIRGSENTFSYNDKNQLVRIDIGTEAGDHEKGTAHFVYDDKNRIQKITFLDESGMEVFIFDSFSYAPQPKNDNFLPLDLFESPASYFIPSIRNVYITGYKAHTPLSDLFTTVFRYKYTFDDAGKLAGLTLNATVLGNIEQEVKMKIALNCK